MPENAPRKVRAKEDSHPTEKESKGKARTAARVRAAEREEEGRKEDVGCATDRIMPRTVQKVVEKGKAKANGEERHLGLRRTGSRRSSKSSPCVAFGKFVLAREHG